MSGQRHAILRQTLELAVATGEDAWPLQQEARRIQAGVIRLLERCCDELSAPDRLHRIDRLELNLGALDPHRFEEDFLAKMGPALRDGLAAAIGRLEANDSSPRFLSQWELLSQYLRLGRLPWWADVAVAGQPQASLALLVREAPDLLRHRMAPLLSDVHVLKRLASHFADQLLARLTALFLPQFGNYPGALAQTLILAAAPAPEMRSPGGWKRLVWQSVLGNVAPASVAPTSRLDYSRSVLMRLAAGRLADYRRLIRQVQDSAASARMADQAAVLEILAQLSGEQPAAKLSGLPSAADFEAAARAVLLPASAARVPDSPLQPTAAAAKGSDEQPVAVRAGDANDAIDGAMPNIRSALSTNPGEHLSLSAAADELPSADLVQQLRQQRVEPPDVTDTDAIPVSNAGLVILWPFLKTFLERLDLVVETGFKDEAARQRGAILLQCLVSGEAEVPEYLLPLNKVLCGLPLDAPCEADGPLRAEEVDECEHLLATVIAQVPILNKMSVAGFRASFLLRAGMLDIRDGAWLLRVERETHDLVLDRFPWGCQWVKLPWMETLLQVEW